MFKEQLQMTSPSYLDAHHVVFENEPKQRLRRGYSVSPSLFTFPLTLPNQSKVLSFQGTGAEEEKAEPTITPFRTADTR